MEPEARVVVVVKGIPKGLADPVVKGIPKGLADPMDLALNESS